MKLGKFKYRTRNGTIVHGEYQHHNQFFYGRVMKPNGAGIATEWIVHRSLGTPLDEADKLTHMVTTSLWFTTPKAEWDTNPELDIVEMV